MTKEHTPEEIKNWLSNIGGVIGIIALKYIAALEEENAELKTLIENMQRDVLSLVKDRMNDDVDQNIIERLADKWGLKEND